jgi:hypothetical protein
MKTKIIASLQRRISEELNVLNPVSLLADKEIDLSKVVDIAVSILYLYTRSSKSNSVKSGMMVEIITAVGAQVRSHLKLKKDTAVASKLGAFILYSFEELGIVKVELSSGNSKHAAYVVKLTDDNALSKMWESVEVHIEEKLPQDHPYEPWTSTKHPTGATLIKTNSKIVLSEVTPETHPIVFDTVNKAQQVGWNINKEIHSLASWALRNKTDAFKDIWSLPSPEAKASKIREAKAVISIASKFLERNFYHLYYLDFRGRKYPATAYLHEQGADLSRGLLLRSDKTRIGEQGYYWLLVSIANNWAGDAGRDDGLKTDKLPLSERVYWCLDNKEILLSYAEKPKVNQGWMAADKPWQFLSACIELRNIDAYERLGNNREDWESHLECFIDGSNNGSQHLSALTKDEITAPHVNLVPSDLPGDLYKYVADHVWEELEKTVANLSKDRVNTLEYVLDELITMKKHIVNCLPKSEERKQLIAKIQSFKAKHEYDIFEAAPLYWWRITSSKERRKIVKR